MANTTISLFVRSTATSVQRGAYGFLLLAVGERKYESAARVIPHETGYQRIAHEHINFLSKTNRSPLDLSCGSLHLKEACARWHTLALLSFEFYWHVAGAKRAFLGTAAVSLRKLSAWTFHAPEKVIFRIE